MGRKRDRDLPKEQRSPTSTGANVSDGFIAGLDIPSLPESLPARLESALTQRIHALLFHLREARNDRYVPTLETRLLRDAHRAVLTGYELGIPDAKVHYATFRKLVEELGYERCEVGFRRLVGGDESG